MTAQILTSTGLIDAPERVLVVVAHPDDIDFGTAGTVAQLTAAGSYVAYCLVTSGEAGEDDMTVSSADLATMREAEQTAAAEKVGVDVLHWLHHPDGQVESNLRLRLDIARVIRIEKPNVVITQSPFRNLDSTYGSHPDHAETAEATLRAVYPDARNPRAFTTELLDKGFAPHTVEQVWVGQSDPDLFIDTTDVFDKKLAALRSHASQVAKRDAEFDLEKLLREWGERLARNGDMPDGRIAEAFRAVDTR
ncbi:MAG: PIG-L deacetylase family protein [Acidimicrobiales bacterium]